MLLHLSMSLASFVLTLVGASISPDVVALARELSCQELTPAEFGMDFAKFKDEKNELK